MKQKRMCSETQVLQISDFLMRFGIFSDEIIMKIENYPHHRLLEENIGTIIARCPMKFVHPSLLEDGTLYLVKDRTGTVLPYINPTLLNSLSVEEILRGLRNGKTYIDFLKIKMNRTDNAVAYQENLPLEGMNTNKKSRQKILDQKRRKHNDKY